MKKKASEQVSKTAALKETYETEIEFMCPVRGLVKQKVTVKKYHGVENKSVPDILPSNNITDILDVKYSGLMLGDNTVDDDIDGDDI